MTPLLGFVELTQIENCLLRSVTPEQTTVHAARVMQIGCTGMMLTPRDALKQPTTGGTVA